MGTIRNHSKRLLKHEILPTYGDLNLSNFGQEAIKWYKLNAKYTNLDFFYQLSEQQKLQFLDNWYSYIPGIGENAFVTFKQCAENTDAYRTVYNYVTIKATNSCVQCCIHSCDDGYFLMYVEDLQQSKTQQLVDDLVYWLDSQEILDYTKMFKFGEFLGFNNFFTN